MSGLFTHDLHDKSLWRRIDSTSKLEGRGVQRVCLRRAAERERRRNGAQVARKKGRSAPQMLAINKSLMGADIAVPRSRDSCFLRCSPTEIIDADDKKPRHGRKTFRSPSSSSSSFTSPPSLDSASTYPRRVAAKRAAPFSFSQSNFQLYKSRGKLSFLARRLENVDEANSRNRYVRFRGKSLTRRTN